MRDARSHAPTRDDSRYGARLPRKATATLAPLASPLFADLRGLPPLIVQCGGREVILDDCACSQNAREAGVAAELDVYEPMIHVFHMFAELPEAGSRCRRPAFYCRRISREADSGDQVMAAITIDIDAHIAVIAARAARQDERAQSRHVRPFDRRRRRASREATSGASSWLEKDAHFAPASIDKRFFRNGAPPPLSPRTHGLANLPQMVAVMARPAPPVIAAVHGVAFPAPGSNSHLR